MVFRIESPNSINTFKQCPRKYFYSYKAQLPRKDSIHTIAGKAVHETLEYLFQNTLQKASLQCLFLCRENNCMILKARDIERLL